jgi:hypothetical protein
MGASIDTSIDTIDTLGAFLDTLGATLDTLETAIPVFGGISFVQLLGLRTAQWR